jgi:hypothetical protein
MMMSRDGEPTIEILGATLEEACFEKRGELFSADLHPIL